MSCSHPIVFKGRLISCRKCVFCQKKFINDWFVRMYLESKFYNPSEVLFLTFTYNEDNLPKNGLLNIKDLQDFWKRLRKYYTGVKIRYFACGEYGDQYGRPHYHAIIYGLPYSQETYDVILSKWAKGFICMKPAVRRNFRYVAKYCVKSHQKTKLDIFTGEVLSEFVTMSRRYGIGYRFLESFENRISILTNSTIDIHGFNYSVPYSFRVKLKKDYNESCRSKVINILYNDLKYKDFNDDLQHELIAKVRADLSSQLCYDPFCDYTYKFFSFTEYLNSLKGIIQREKVYCALHKIDINKFYLDIYEYGPVSYNLKGLVYEGLKNTDFFNQVFCDYICNCCDYLYY